MNQRLTIKKIEGLSSDNELQDSIQKHISDSTEWINAQIKEGLRRAGIEFGSALDLKELVDNGLELERQSINKFDLYEDTFLVNSVPFLKIVRVGLSLKAYFL